MVEWVHAQQVTRDTACTLEEVQQLADIILVQLRQGDLHVWHTAVDMRNHRTQLGHLVHLVHAFACQEVESVEVILIVWEWHSIVALLHADNGLEQHTLALLDILTHRVQVGRQVHASREDTLAVFALRLAVQLFPPLAHVVQLRVVVHQNLHFLAFVLIQHVACGCVLCGWVSLESGIDAANLHHALSAINQRLYIISRARDRQQTHWRQHGEAATDIILDHEGLVTLLRSQSAQRTFLRIGDAHDQLLSGLFALLLLQLSLQQTESQRWLGGGTRLRDTDDTKLLILQQRLQLVQIILADVLTRIHDSWLLALQPCKTAAQRVDHRFRTQVRTADTDAHDHLALLAKQVCGCLYVRQLWTDVGWQVHPAQEIVTQARAVYQLLLCHSYLCLKSLYCLSANRLGV